LRKASGIAKGSGTPNKEKIGSIKRSQIEEIAKKKMVDLNTSDLAAAMKTIEGTAKSMGLTVEG
jgi:large subunit ribosomal protein L11